MIKSFRQMPTNRAFPILVLILATLLLGINISGLFIDLRPSEFDEQDLVFDNDLVYSYEEALEKIDIRSGEDIESYLIRLASDLQKSVAHIEWIKIEDTKKYNQLVPLHENYILHLMGIYSGIPEFQKYHFANYRRSLERGIGICGDMSMITSQVLRKNGIESKIVSFPGHVFVEVFKDGQSIGIVDSDFGVFMPLSVSNILEDFSLLEEYYSAAGHNEETIDYLISWLDSGYPVYFNDEKHFITKKYYFEYITYFIKWFLPFMLLVFLVVRYAKTR